MKIEDNGIWKSNVLLSEHIDDIKKITFYIFRMFENAFLFLVFLFLDHVHKVDTLLIIFLFFRLKMLGLNRWLARFDSYSLVHMLFRLSLSDNFLGEISEL